MKFKIRYPYENQLSNNWYGIDCDPTLKNEIYLFTNQKEITFDEVIELYNSLFNKTNYLGAMSFIYFKYYKEFYFYILEMSKKNSEYKNNYFCKRFIKKYLIRWLAFIKHSDDSVNPQNEYIKKLGELLL